jgi:ankyrin repeat protein
MWLVLCGGIGMNTVEMRASDDVAGDETMLLHTAVQENSAILVEGLIAIGIDCNVKNMLGNTPLLEAVIGGHRAAAIALLTAPKLDVKAVDRAGHNAWYYAAEKGDIDLLELLQERSEWSEGRRAWLVAAMRTGLRR